MYSISQLCKLFKLSRSTLLYYDSIGLLIASERTKSNYRLYSDEDKAKLGQICIYREAGISLEKIKKLLNSSDTKEETVLQDRLKELNSELYLLRLQQKILIELLKTRNTEDTSVMLNTGTLVNVLKTSGVTDHNLERLHAEFERQSPEEHQLFLEFLGIDNVDIRIIRQNARTFFD